MDTNTITKICAFVFVGGFAIGAGIIMILTDVFIVPGRITWHGPMSVFLGILSIGAATCIS